MWSQNTIYHDCKPTKKAMFYKHLSCEVIGGKAPHSICTMWQEKNKEEKPINHWIETLIYKKYMFFYSNAYGWETWHFDIEILEFQKNQVSRWKLKENILFSRSVPVVPEVNIYKTGDLRLLAEHRLTGTGSSDAASILSKRVCTSGNAESLAIIQTLTSFWSLGRISSNVPSKS